MTMSARQVVQQFQAACAGGDLARCQGLFNEHGRSLRWVLNRCFAKACEHNQVAVAQWLSTLVPIDIRGQFDGVIKTVCSAGYEDLAKWLWSQIPQSHRQQYLARTCFHMACLAGSLPLVQHFFPKLLVCGGGGDGDGEEKEEAVVEWNTRCEQVYYDMAVKDACREGRLEVVQWLHQTTTSMHLPDFIKFPDAFHNACIHNRLAVAQWLWSTCVQEGHKDLAHIQESATVDFADACGRGHLAIVQWLLQGEGKEEVEGGLAAPPPVDVHYSEERPLQWACQCGHLAIVQCLLKFYDVHAPGFWTTPRACGVCLAFDKACKFGFFHVAAWMRQECPHDAPWPGRALQKLQHYHWEGNRSIWVATVLRAQSVGVRSLVCNIPI